MTRLSVVSLLAAAHLSIAAAAIGQSGGPAPLADSLVSSTQIRATGSATIAEYTSGWLELLRSPDTAESEQAQRALLAPLGASPSPSFRIQYGSRLKADLFRLMAGTDAQAVFAVALAGELATVDGHTIVLRGLNDDRAPVRYAAARGARHQLMSIDDGPAALNAQHRDAMISSVAARVEVESNPVVLDGLLTVASDAVVRQSDAANAILEHLCLALSENLRADALSTDALAESRACLRLVGSAQQHFRNRRGDFPDGLSESAAILAGDAMGYVLAAVENDADAASPDTSSALGQLVKSAHNLVFFAHTARVGQQDGANNEVPDAFERWGRTGSARELRTAIEKWIGDGGVLRAAPYNVAPATFVGE